MNMNMRRHQSGFTILELMAVVAVLAVIIGFGVPSMRQFIANQQVRNASYDLFTSFNMARSEATKRARDVTVIATNAANWGAGWKVMTGTPGTPGTDLYARDPLPTDIAVAEAGGLGSVTFKANGRLTPGQAPTFTFRSASFSNVTERCLNVDASGKAISGC